uniref:Uncharacterized protein n=1 Tax=Homo sapiens TaxID=9606 RepID=M0QZU9_HUMAN
MLENLALISSLDCPLHLCQFPDLSPCWRVCLERLLSARSALW